MMSGVELNALMTQVAETGNLPPAFQQQVTAAGGASKPYNRELWRIQNGMLEKALVNFVVEKSRFKKASAIGVYYSGLVTKAALNLIEVTSLKTGKKFWQK